MFETREDAAGKTILTPEREHDEDSDIAAATIERGRARECERRRRREGWEALPWGSLFRAIDFHPPPTINRPGQRHQHIGNQREIEWDWRVAPACFSLASLRLRIFSPFSSRWSFSLISTSTSLQSQPQPFFPLRFFTISYLASPFPVFILLVFSSLKATYDLNPPSCTEQ